MQQVQVVLVEVLLMLVEVVLWVQELPIKVLLVELVMLAVVVLEQLLRILAGRLKPLQIDTPPPGAYGTYVALALGLVFLVLALRNSRAGHHGA